MTLDTPPQPCAVDPEIVQAAIREAREAGVDVADLPLNRIARRAGVSRATLFRRIGTRRALEQAVRLYGVDPGIRMTVRDRAVAAALDLIESNGLESLTVDAIARRAGCAATSVYTQFGGKDDLLSAVFEAYSPLASVEHAVTHRPRRFEDQVRGVYEAFFDAAVRRSAVIALLRDAWAHRSPAADAAHRILLRGVLTLIGDWLAEEAAKGNCRRLEPETGAAILLGPIVMRLAMCAAARPRGGALPERDGLIDALTGSFCRAVAVGR